LRYTDVGLKFQNWKKNKKLTTNIKHHHFFVFIAITIYVYFTELQFMMMTEIPLLYPLHVTHPVAFATFSQ
jgi:hypothetical protein